MSLTKSISHMSLAMLTAALVACGGKPQAFPTTPQSGTPVFSGQYCDAASAIALNHLVSLQSSLGDYESNPLSLDELIERKTKLLVDVSVPLDEAAKKAIALGKPAKSFDSYGIILGNGYILTTGHGIRDHVTGGISDIIQLEQTVGAGQAAVPHNVTWIPSKDLALLYLLPAGNLQPEVTYRLSSSLKLGEKLYMIKKGPNGFVPIEGEILSPKTDFSPGDGFYYQGGISTNIPSERGDSGLPVFDVNGNLVGLASGITLKGRPITVITGADAVPPLLDAAMQQMANCGQTKRP